MGGGGGSSPISMTYVMYAPYVEARHSAFLNSMFSYRVAACATNPFEVYTPIMVDNAFFGAGYALSSFPSLYDMYGKFMAGLDIEALWTQEYNDTLDSAVMNNLVAAEGALLDDELESTSIPRFQAGMRDINSVISSSYAVGRSILEDSRTKLVEKFSAELKYKLIPIAQERWKTHLDWNQQVVKVYMEVIKFYLLAKTDQDEINYAMAAKKALWPFTVLDFERAGLGALQGATVTAKEGVAGASTASKVLSGALSGAAMGAMIGSNVSASAGSLLSLGGSTYAGAGAIVGAGLGIAAALTY